MVSRVVKIDRFTVLLIVIGGLASVLVLLRMVTYGVGIGGDATLYISTTQNLMTGNGFINYEGLPYSHGAAPLYPLILTFISGLGIEVLQAAKYINAIAFGLTVIVIAMWLKSRVRSKFWVVWAACTCALQTSLAEFSAFAMTEILFILFVVLSLLILERFLITGKKSFLVWAAFSTAVATLYRYIGVTLIVTGLLVIFLFRKSRLRTKLNDATVWCVVTSFPLGIWILRNILTIETIAGRLKPDEYSLLNSLHNIIDEITLWALGETGLRVLEDQLYKLLEFPLLGRYTLVAAVTIKAAILVNVTIIVGVVLARYRSGFLKRNRNLRAVCASFILVYMGFLMVITPLGNIVLPARYLLPIFPPVLLVSTTFLSELSDLTTRLGSKYKKVSARNLVQFFGVPFVMLIWLLLWIVPNYDSIRSWNDYGRAYSSKRWIESEVLAFLNYNPPQGTIYSNNHVALYHLPIDQSSYHVYDLPLDLNRAQNQMYTAHTIGNYIYVVWFYSSSHHISPNYSVEDLGSSLGVEEVVAILQDGVILKVDPKSTTYPSNQQDDFLFEILLTDVIQINYPYFEVYLDKKGNRVIYVRENCWLNLEDIGRKFILHIHPVDQIAHSDRPNIGFDSIEFSFGDYAVPIGNHCVAILPLPEYDIAYLRLGEIRNDKMTFWKGKVDVG